ncbi:hypothetical protein AB0C07_08800 [Actinoplanes missouriensis]|uniref:hypothetical protein n=1 Tax=Actinoplanes missouriensis TaxID=1866 RepID=UPI003411F58A
MTAHTLILAVAVGLVVGVTGRVLLRRKRAVPGWLPVAAAMAAAVLAAVIARMANSERSGLTLFEVALQVLFAGSGVAIVAFTADRPASRWDRRGHEVR